MPVKMATKTKFSTSINISSNVVHDLTCTLCAKKNKTIKSVKFCLECREYLCSGCTELHNSFSLMAGHVFEKAELGSMDKTFSRPHISIERCPKHPAEIIKMYCAIHDRVACTVCTIIDHKVCNDIHYITDVAGTLYTEQMKTDAITALLKASEKMKTLKEMCNKTLDDLNTAKQTTLEEIQKFRKELINILNKLEQNTKQQLDDQYQTLQIQWQVLIEKGTAIQHNLQKLLNQLLNTESNISQQFIFTKIIKENISLAQTMSSQLLSSSIHITFSQSQAIKSCFEQLSALGNVTHSIENKKLILYTIKESHKYNVRIKNDNDTCSIYGSCVLDSGHLLLADYSNTKIKLFEINNNAVTSYCTLSDPPYAVCIVSDVEAAVSLNNKMIQFVSINNGLLPTRKLKLDHDCFGLAIAVDKMYITYGDNLYVHEVNGKLLQTINKDQSGQKIFSSACHLTVSNNGNIHVADYNNGLITLNTEGQVMWKYTGSDLKGPVGVCTDDCGNVFVCGHLSHNVLKLGHGGHSRGELVNKTHVVADPICVLLDRKKCRLIITCYSNVIILAVSLEQM